MSRSIPRHPYHILSGLFCGFGTPAICAGLVYLFGDLCWPQRLGALYVGIAVLIQGLLAADKSLFNKTLSNGTILKDHINGICFFFAVFGTIFAAFGDLLPPSFYYNIPMCKA